MRNKIQSIYKVRKTIVFSILISLLFIPVALQANDYIIINKIMYDSPLNEQIATGVAYSNGEYVELYNAGVDAVNLTGWVLRGGGTTEIYSFPTNTVMAPKSYLIVAYQYNNSGFTLDQLYTGLTATDNHQIQYQRKIILSNSGEPVYLRDSYGITKDSIYYDGTSSKTKPNRLSADNADGLAGNSCVCLQRKTATFDANSIAIPNNLEWTAAVVTPFQLSTVYKAPAIPGVTDLALPTGQNYIISVTPLDETSQVDISSGQVTLHNDARGIISVQYFDGLGRPQQTVQRGITSEKADMVTLTEYDNMGRGNIHWLPTPIASNSGAFVDVTTFKSTAISSHNSDNRPFSETKYEPSPLNRIQEEFGPGDAWKTNNKRTQQSYSANSTDIAYYYVNASGNLQRGTNYAAYRLYATLSTDEDGKTVTEYKDKLGRVVMKQSDTDVQTYYVYNDLGQLSYVLPPLASDQITAQRAYADTETALKQYCFLYHYDERGNCSYKRLPGCDPIYMVYDQANRLVLSQDGNQRLKSKWTITKYDDLGRILYTGIINREIAQSEKDIIHNNVITESLGTSNPFHDTGYTCNYFVSEIDPLTVNYYDNYSFISNLSTDDIKAKLPYDNSKEQEYGKQYTSAKGLLTGTRTYTLDNSGIYTVTAMYYDIKGQLIQSRATNHLDGYDLVYTKYDFSGKPTKTLKGHSISSNTTGVSEVYRYVYDHAGRSTKTFYQLNGGTEVLLTDQSQSGAYDELGRLRTKKRHNGTDLEQFDYNIRNWTTKINSGTFEENLYYNTNPISTTPCFNGNLSYSTWTYNGTTNGYSYSYDNLNRLLSAAFKQGTSSLPNNSFDESFTYDKMGNILTLQRKSNNILVDDLTLHYANGGLSNQLDWVTDAKGTQGLSDTKEYQDISKATSNEFAYDANGNMTKDLDRNIVTIRYNSLNLPDTIQFQNGNQTINRYNAAGQKLETDYYTCQSEVIDPIEVGKIRPVTYDPTQVSYSGTAYVNNFEYTKTKEFINQYGGYYQNKYTFSKVFNSEGYVTGSVVPDLNNYLNGIQYNYFRHDHLGNTREVWCAAYNKNSGLQPAGTIQQTQYYPSGLPLASNIGDNPGTQNRKYNGKEFIEMHGYDTYDYGARSMYPALGDGFMSVDPMCEMYYSISPYTYCAGNPIKYIDVDGKYIKGTDGGKATYSKKTGWSNASNDAIRIGNALLKTRNGRFYLREMMKKNYPIELLMSKATRSSKKEDVTEYRLGEANFSYNIKTGEVLSGTFTIFEGSINDMIKQGGTPLAMRYRGLKDNDERIGVAAAHEAFHLTDKQNILDKEENDSRKRKDPKTNDLINTEESPREIEIFTIDEFRPNPTPIKSPFPNPIPPINPQPFPMDLGK